LKAIMVMFDTLNRRHLPPYGCDWVHAPNFSRLAERTVTFDNSYVCSMPCMPARRDFHTGRPNFLHRSWGPLEPFDDSVPRILRDAGVYTHMITDHLHYWEPGGATYHHQYNTYEFVRGTCGDFWVGQVADPPCEDVYQGWNADPSRWHRQERINRLAMPNEADIPVSRTFAGGLEFIEKNHDQDNWFLQLETFAPHEPFRSDAKYQQLYAKEHYDTYRGLIHDWPKYQEVSESSQTVEHLRYEYASLLSMCDEKLGHVLDTMDRLSLWEDTMLIVWTDHGFLLGEHNMWAKCWMPFYQEVAHTPFFMWDPRSKRQSERRQALVQPAIDLGPTLLDFFNQAPTADITGCILKDTVDRDEAVRNYALFGMHGHHVNITDGCYVYMRGPEAAANQPINEYTLMPCNMTEFFFPSRLKEIDPANPFGFTKGVQTMRIPGGMWESMQFDWPTLLWDLQTDPSQQKPLDNPSVEKEMIGQMVRMMKDLDAPKEQYERLGLT